MSDPRNKVLTERQQQALDFIAGYTAAQGYPPSLREIGEAMGIRSTNAVNDHLQALERKGVLERDRSKGRGCGKSRALRVVGGPVDPERCAWTPETCTGATAE